MIPKIIHQTYKDIQPFLENSLWLERTNPDWDYRFYDDSAVEDYIASCGREIKTAYYSINPEYMAARIDLFRYNLMLEFGGVYLDIKSSIRKPLDDVLRDDDEYILSHWPIEWEDQRGLRAWGKHSEISNPRGEYQQWHIIAQENHPFLEAVIERVLENIHLANQNHTGRKGVIKTTGPVAYSQAIEPLLMDNVYRLVEMHELGLVYTVLNSNIEHYTLFDHYANLTTPLLGNENDNT